MPQVVIAAAAWAAGALATAAGWSAFAVAAVKFAVAFAISAAIASRARRKAAEVSSQERRETIRSPAAPRRVIYGSGVRTGGVLVHAITEGENNRFMHMIVVLSHGLCTGVEPVFWLNDKTSDHADFAGKVTLQYFSGTEDQAACAAMIAANSGGWTEDHQLKGISYVYVKLEHDSVAFAGGLPGLSFFAGGRLIEDPRIVVPEGEEPLGYWLGSRSNPALVMLDYLRADYGMNVPDSLIDLSSFIAAANICDEPVATSMYDPENAGFWVPNHNGSVPRYTMDGVIDLSAAPADIVDSIQSTCAGRLVFTGGKYRFYVGAYQSPGPATLKARQLRGEPVIRMQPSRSELFNTVRGTYIEPRQGWHEYDYTPQVDGAALVEDQSEIVQTLDFPHTIHGPTCQRLARLALNRARNLRTVQLPLNWSGLQYTLWQTVTIPDIPGVPPGVYRITEFALAEGGGVDVTATAERAEDYAWDVSMETPVPFLATEPNNLGITGLNAHLPHWPVPMLRVSFTVTGAPFSNWFNLNLLGLSGYVIQWAEADKEFGPNIAVVARSMTGDEVVDWWTTGIEAGVDYKVRVRPAFAGGGGPAWSTATAVAQPAPLDPPDVALTPRTIEATNILSIYVAEAVVQFRADGTLRTSYTDAATSTTVINDIAGEWLADGSLAGGLGEQLQVRAFVASADTSLVAGDHVLPVAGADLTEAAAPWYGLHQQRTWQVLAGGGSPNGRLPLTFQIRKVTGEIVGQARIDLKATYTP